MNTDRGPIKRFKLRPCGFVCPRNTSLVTGVVTGLLALVLAGCRPGVDAGSLTETPWRVVDVEIAAPTAPGIKGEGKETVDASAGAWFRFYPDGVATFVLESRFRAGRWNLDAATDTVTVELADGQARVFRTGLGWDGHLRVSEPALGDNATLVAERDKFRYGDRDIYSEAMNLWRMPLEGEVTDEVLRARLRSMVRYLAAYFEAAVAQDLDTVNVSALSTPFIFGSNGLGLRQETALPIEWVVLFPEREDCRRMSRLIAGLFKDISMPATQNRFQRFASMFRQMDQLLSAETGAEE